jgi:hypothetical protein
MPQFHFNLICYTENLTSKILCIIVRVSMTYF